MLGEREGLPEELWRVEIQDYGDLLNAHYWDYIEAGGVETEFALHLQEKVNKKSAKIPQYLQHCATCWLVIVALGDRPSSYYEPGDEVMTTQYKSAFERVFFMDKTLQRIWELRVQKEVST